VKRDRYGLRASANAPGLLGGAADISSTPGKGTTITVELPLIEGDIEDGDDNSDA